MTKDVLLSISGLQFEIDENEPVEIISCAEYYYRNNKHYIIYDEVLTDDHGNTEVNKNTIKISEKQVDIIKKGISNVHMTFEEGKKNMTFYSTPFGELLIGIYTVKMGVDIEENQLKLKLDYTLDINYNHVSDCSIVVKAKAK